ncbi:MAG: hypothetical protein HN368_19550, partial [Spirochaetales bacterium]|nr:hypothetical protein [Spirochaetales bacterium]
MTFIPKPMGKKKHRFSFLSCLICVAFLAAFFCSPRLLRRCNRNSSPTSVDADYSVPNLTLTHSVLSAAMPISSANGEVLRYSIDVDPSYPPPLPSEAFDRYTVSLNWKLTSDLPDEGIPSLYVFQGIKIALLTFKGSYTLYQHPSAPEANNYLFLFNFESGEIINQTIIDGNISGVVFIAGLIDVQIKDGNESNMFFRVEHESIEQVWHPGFLRVRVDPARSDFFIDDQHVENGSGLQIGLLDGNHNLRTECEGYIADFRDVLLEPGTALDLNIILEPNINFQWIEESRYPVEILAIDNEIGEPKKSAQDGAVCLATFEKRSVNHDGSKKTIT